MTRSLLPTIVILFLCSGEARAQNGPILPADDPVLWFSNSLLARGYLADLDPGILPYLERNYQLAIESSLAEAPLPEKEWFRRIADRLHTFPKGKTATGIRIRAGSTIATQERSDLLHTEISQSSVVYSLVSFESWFSAGNWTGAWGWRHDRYYDRDPDGLDTAHRLAIRPENAYVSYEGTYASFLFGRVRQHWGGYGQPGLILSDNPRPMDHLSFRLGTPRLNLRSSISELDSITGDGRFTGIAGDDSVATGSERRYLAAHRLTFSKPGSWSVGLMHSILYSGSNSGLSLKFLNPFQLALLSVDEKPKNEENNGLLGLFFQIQATAILIQGQIALDDFDILNGKEPASIAASFTVYRAGLTPDFDVSVSGTLVTARTYNSLQNEGKYLYLGRGIGTQYSDFVTIRIAAHWMKLPGWRISPGVDILLQGEQDIRNSFPANDAADLILDGTVERTFRPYIRALGLVGRSLDLRFDAGFNFSSNQHHVKGQSSTDFVGSASLSYRFNWTQAY